MKTVNNTIWQPFFSIIIPTYNQAEYLKLALDSILSQSDSDWEAIVVNDSSTDHTGDVLVRYARKDDRIHKENGGTASALNGGLRNVNGDWLGWLSSNDLYEPFKLALHRRWIYDNPDSKFHFSYFKLLWEESGKIEEHDLWVPLPEREFYLIGLFYCNFVSGISICFHKDIIKDIGYFDDSYRYTQDYDMWLRVFQRFPARFIPEPTCINRTHPNQSSYVFLEACYYDTSKSAIRFINSHPFEEWFPLLDMRDVGQVSRAIYKTLEIVSYPTAYVYALGFHDGLIQRLLEFVPSSEQYVGKQNAKHLQSLLVKEILNGVEAQSESTMTRIWQEARIAFEDSSPLISYTPVDYIHLASSRVRNNRMDFESHYLGRNSLEALRRYLRQFGHFLEGKVLDAPRAHYHWREIFSEIDKRALLNPALQKRITADAYDQFFEYYQHVPDCHYLDQGMYVDIKTWLVDDILVKVDRMSMAHALESRAPFLDYRVVEFAASLPVNLKMKFFQKKYLFKKSQKNRIPRSVINRAKKGFNAPIAYWLASSMRDRFYDLTTSSSMARAYFNRPFVDHLWQEHVTKVQDHSLKLFGLITFLLWSDKFQAVLDL